MRIQISAENIVEKHNLENEKSFSISNVGFIFDILRNKLYSDKIGSICREILANARDAHREAEISSEPIEVEFPDFINSTNFIIRDFGIGISPERIENVFIKYAESTKRGSNLQTGGFGLGAKTPFAYSDTFAIKTTTEGVERIYTCFIDETKLGKIAQVKQQKTEKQTGTEIIIPIKKQDLDKFIVGVKKATEYWSVKPKIFGTSFSYPNEEVIIAGKNWKIIKNQKHHYGTQTKFIVDGIQYENINLASLNSKWWKDIFSVYFQSGYTEAMLVLFFGVGDVSLSASRETIEFDQITIENLDFAFEKIFHDIKKEINEQIANASSYKEAIIKFSKLDSFGIISRGSIFSWQNKKLWSVKQTSLGGVIRFNKESILNKESRHQKSSTVSTICFEENDLFCINDTECRTSISQVKKLFDKFPTKTMFYVLNANNERLTKLRENFFIDDLEPVYFSKEIKTKSRKEVIDRISTFKFNGHFFIQGKAEEILKSTNEKVFALLDFKKNPLLGANFMISFARAFPNVSIFGFKSGSDAKKIKSLTKNMKAISDFCFDYAKTNNINLLELKTISESDILKTELQSKNIKNNSSPMKKLLTENEELIANKEKFKKFLFMSDIDKNEKGNPRVFKHEYDSLVVKQYPLLKFLYMSNEKEMVNAMIEYINLMDEK